MNLTSPNDSYDEVFLGNYADIHVHDARRGGQGGLMVENRAILTIVSAVFLPMTLISGIYGMNFRDMPELAWPEGYPLALGAMTAVAGGMLWFFYRRRWFE